MISLEQIRLLEGKVTRAVELIRVLKEENGTLRRGLESAQRRMRELETLVEGFKADQKEIESAILRALGSLDELEESVSAPRPAASRKLADGQGAATAEPRATSASSAGAGAPAAHRESEPATPIEAKPSKGELDIF